MDLDNCVCNDAHRLPILACHPGPNKPAIIWDAYHAACVADAPANVHLWQSRTDIVVMTGRPWKFLANTSWWFKKHGLRFTTIFMRSSNDNTTSAVELKRAWALECLNAGFQIEHAYDDRVDIIAAYRSLGIEATQTCAHDKEWT